MSNSLDRATNIVEWYKGLGRDSTAITEISYNHKQMRVYIFDVTKEMVRAKTKFKEAEANLEIKKNQFRVDFSYKGTTKADWQARANVEDEIKKVVEMEAIYDSYYNILFAMKGICEEMRERIALLKDEYNEEKFYTKREIDDKPSK